MPSATIKTAQPALAPHRHRLVALTLAATLLAAGAGTVAATSLKDADLRAGPGGWTAEPIQFNDPPVVKGARGGDKSSMFSTYFGDPAVRKGAGGRQ